MRAVQPRREAEHQGAEASAETLLLERLLIDNYAALIALVSRRCGRRAEAADLLQEAIRITIEHHSKGRIADIQRLPGYVFRTALNLLRNHTRAARNRPELHTSESEADRAMGGDIVDVLCDDTVARQVRDALCCLRQPRDRMVIQRFYMNEEPKADICRDLGISPTCFDKIAFRARQRMKDILEGTLDFI